MPIAVMDFINVYIFPVVASLCTNIHNMLATTFASFCENNIFFLIFFFQFTMKYGKNIVYWQAMCNNIFSGEHVLAGVVFWIGCFVICL